jgi:betaine-aldehyde dehydrogenase
VSELGTAAPEVVRHAQMHIAGSWTDSDTGRRLEAINPTNEQVLATFPDGSAADVDRAVESATDAAAGWRATAWPARARLLHQLADRIEESTDELAMLDALDAGKPVRIMRKDVGRAAAEIRYYAGLASEARGSTSPLAEESLSYTLREPYGVVGRIVPFNHPFKFASGKIAAALAAGNAVILKPGEQTSLSALEFARLAEDLLPTGLLNVVTGDGATVGGALVAHPRVPRIAFTGSVGVGKAIMRSAADHIKHVSLELGGKNPIIVFPDVDPRRAAIAAVAGMNIAASTGQSCGSTSRLFVHEDVREPFIEALVEHLGTLRIGDPTEDETQVGPLAFRSQYDRVVSFIDQGVDEGARLVYGGRRPAAHPEGYFLEPAVFVDVEDEMTIAREEIFGPVFSVLGWRDVDDVIARANSLPLGLTANIWTENVSTAHRVAAALEAGYVYVNGDGRRPPGAPFGGWKSSGLGKENSLEELLSFTREKTVTVTYH